MNVPRSVAAALVTAALTLPPWSPPAAAQEAEGPPATAVAADPFAPVFGELLKAWPPLRERLRGEAPGTRLFLEDGDGRHPTGVAFIAVAERHPERLRPIAVLAIDEDGDLPVDQEPDLDSDLYIADWGADGVADAILDYTDDDGDQDVDAMTFFSTPGQPPALRAWWVRDLSDDNLLWHDAGFAYLPEECDSRSHFSGDESFVELGLDSAAEMWMPIGESGFFFDLDRDGVAEANLYVRGSPEAIIGGRLSFDADGDATPEEPRDYDVSITGWSLAPAPAPAAPQSTQPVSAPAGENGAEKAPTEDTPAPAADPAPRLDAPLAAQTIPERFLEPPGTLRGIAVAPWLGHARARSWFLAAPWRRLLLTWDELDHNVDSTRDGGEERWEGVVAADFPEAPALGAPAGGALNRRHELVLAPQGPVALYFHPTDRRVHLRHAERGWMDVDFDLDGTLDMRYMLADTDRDGFVDTWELDVDADGEVDDRWTASATPVELGTDWHEIHRQVSATLATSAVQSYRLRRLLQAAVRKLDREASDPLETIVENGLESRRITPTLAAKLGASLEARRFFDDLLCDRLAHKLRGLYPEETLWRTFEQARAAGDRAQEAQIIAQAFGVSPPAGPPPRDAIARKRVDWASEWIPDHVGWESLRIAYAFHRGLFTFFGKAEERLILAGVGEQPDVHRERGWARRPLDPSAPPGCGGLSLWVGGARYPAHRPANADTPSFESKLLEATNDKVTVEILIRGVGPTPRPYTLRLRCSALTGRVESPVEVVVEDGRPEAELRLGVGLVKLRGEKVFLDTSAGILGTWGLAAPEVGRIGMGIVFPPAAFVRFADLEGENQIVLSLRHGEPRRYFLVCDWLAARRFDRSPSPADWLERLRRAAATVRDDR